MKKRQPIHPKLYIDFKEKNGKKVFYYISNIFNEHCNRLVQKEFVNFNAGDVKKHLYDENRKQLAILKKYLQTQKKVLEKRKKGRNYEACEIIKSSIKAMVDFENEFNVWFQQNKVG